MINAHLRNGLPFHSLRVQIFPPEAVKMRMMLVSAAQHGSGYNAIFPPVGPGHCQQLHRFIFMWRGKNLTQIFSTHPYQTDAGMVWA